MNPPITDTNDRAEPIPESATASAYEFCRDSGVLDFWNAEPDLYSEDDGQAVE